MLLICPARNFRNNSKKSKFSDGYTRANSADPDQTAPRGLQCLQFRLHFNESFEPRSEKTGLRGF